MDKFKILDFILSIWLILFTFGVLFLIGYTASSVEYKQNQVYKEILEHEFGQTFKTYNDYVLYKIEKGG